LKLTLPHQNPQTATRRSCNPQLPREGADPTVALIPACGTNVSGEDRQSALANQSAFPACRAKRRRGRMETTMPRTFIGLPLIGVMAALLSACAYPQYVNDEYRYIPLKTFAHDNRSYRIFDKPSAGKLIITPSLATAVSDGVIRNATFGRYHNRTERHTIETAAQAFLTSQGRKCTLTGGDLVYDPQWEFTYVCEIVYTATP
jgi:hypothetical protein